MGVIKCKMCGAPLQIREGAYTADCSYCGSLQTIPKADDELKLKLFERANDLRLRCDFDQASNVFQNIIAQFPEEAEAYWGLCLCKYGIEYVDDPRTMSKIPTCHRTQPQSIFIDDNFINACEFGGVARWKYEEEAEEIDKIQKKILDISRAENPYDIFICYKETDDDTGSRTEDSATAQDIYTELVRNNYRVFYSRVTLRGKAGSEYEPYIYSALSSAKVMLVLGSKSEYFNAVWLKNEWSRYLGMMQQGNKTIIPCFEHIRAEELPRQLRNFQALDMGNKLFFNDLMSNIRRLIPKHTPVAAAAPDAVQNVTTGPTRKELNYEDGVYVGEALGNRYHGTGTRYYVSGRKYEGKWNMGEFVEGTITYENGDTWTGEWKNGQPFNGQGKAHFSRKDDKASIYNEGTLKNGLMHGECKKYINGQLVAEGFYENGNLNGRGIAYFRNGKLFKGEFKNGYPVKGEGYFSLPYAQLHFEGFWENGKPIGKGIAYSPNGGETFDVYADDSGRWTGIVRYMSNGNRFEGSMLNGAADGKGRIYTKDEKLIYDGEFRNSKFTGYGIRYYDNNARYEGEWLDDKREGEGVIYNNDGTTWTGQWHNDNPFEGNGTLIYKSGQRYEGEVKNGVCEGMGKCLYKNGDQFEGEWRNDRPYKGTYYYRDGSTWTGIYENGRQFEGCGTTLKENGEKYVGEIKGGFFDGEGTYYYPEGKWEGIWKKGYRYTGHGLLFHMTDGKRNGKYYVGEMVNGVACGKGKLVDADKNRAEGEWKGDKLYNGRIYNAKNQVIDTYINGQSQNEKKKNVANGIMGFLSKL